MSPLTVRSTFPLRVLSSVSNPHPKSRSVVARRSSSVQNTSGSRMSCEGLVQFEPGDEPGDVQGGDLQTLVGMNVETPLCGINTRIFG